MCLAAAGCTSLAPPPLPPESALAVNPVGLAADPEPELRLRPGDVVRVSATSGSSETESRVWQATVDAQGTAHLSQLGSLRLEGLTVARAEELVHAAALTHARFETVSLSVAGTEGQRATVLGAVAQQGSLAVRPGMRIAELITSSGGVLSAPDPVTAAPVALGDLRAAVVTRDGRPLPIDVALAMRGDPRHNVFVHAGDHLYVPRREAGSVVVFGQVGSPGVFALQLPMRMTEALARAGGITTDGDKSDIRLLRGPVEAPVAFQADLAAIVDGVAPDVQLEPGDVLFVTDDPVEDIGEVMGLLLPLAATASASLLMAVVLSSR